MCRLLAGYFGLALIYVSVSLNNAVHVIQKPRFYSWRIGGSAAIFCLYSKAQLKAKAEWYKADKYDGKQELITARGRFETGLNLTEGALLYIHDLHKEDEGVYFCTIGNHRGPGTVLQITRSLKFSEAQYRTKMKDGLMVFQGLLLALFIGAMLLRRHKLLENQDSIYEEPESDHIYEGLAIETCGGGLYEELSVYTQPEGTEAPWE